MSSKHTLCVSQFCSKQANKKNESETKIESEKNQEIKNDCHVIIDGKNNTKGILSSVGISGMYFCLPYQLWTHVC